MCFTDSGKITKQGRKPKKLDFVGEPPPVTTLVVGWRAWRAKKTGTSGTVELESPLQHTVWKPDKPMDGKVGATSEGIYCFKTLEALKRYTHIATDAKDIVVGQVALWGDVAEHKDGFRGEHGYPVRIWTNDLTIQCALRDTYRMSVQMAYAKTLNEAALATS